ncbi:50S ribosomal protein L22 [Candidatus Woesearchaeota archaeon]|nr:50S ribosomal protein L22 [Candidatus Woesearchaeota archaeon]
MTTNYRYSAKCGENSARALGRNLPISRKHAVEISAHIRGLPLSKAKKILQNTIDMKNPIPFKRYNWNVGHRRGMGPGRFPVLACKGIIKILSLAESNAQYKGLSTSDLVIKHINAQQGPVSYHFKRKGRRKAKSTHVEIILEEQKKLKSQNKQENN